MSLFDFDFRPPVGHGPNHGIGDFAASAWRTPFPMERIPRGMPDHLTFSDIFQKFGAGVSDTPLGNVEQLLKNVSGLDFSSSEMNRQSGDQPDFFINKVGQLIANPLAPPLRPGESLNIEIQADGMEPPGELQRSMIQASLDAFISSHPWLDGVPRTWQDVLRRLSRMMTGRGFCPFPDYRDSDNYQPGGGRERGRGSGSGSGGSGGGSRGGWDGGGSGGGWDGGGSGGEMAPAARWDGKSHGDMSLVGLSESALGSSLWAETRHAGVCEGGNLGCAASVSKVLQEGGYGYADSAGVLELARQLGAKQWTESGVDGAQPGDVIYSDGGGSRQHIGIVGKDENGELVIYNNHSSDGRWHKDKWNDCSIITSFSPDQIRVLHAPGGSAESNSKLV